MGTTLDIVNEWAADNEEKQLLVKTRSGLPLRWINQGQLRYADKSEMLRAVWNPTITSTGNIALVSGFLREFPDLVKYNVSSTTNLPLIKIDYWEAINVDFSTTTHYSIHNGSFYVWSAGALTPSITYIKRPTIMTNILTESLEIPLEFQHNLILYLDIMFDGSKGTINSIDKHVLLKTFDQQAGLDGLKFRQRNDSSPVMRSYRLG